MTSSPALGYAGFISYSHADEGAARWLHAKLESYEVPRILRQRCKNHIRPNGRLGRFFRDIDELPAAMDLPEKIRDALEKSACLIVICSPQSVKSPWVAKEVSHYLSLGDNRRILLAVTDGDPVEVAHPLLQRYEPLVADLRPSQYGRELGFLKIVSGIVGVSLGDLRDREAEANRTRSRRRNLVLAVVAALLLCAIGGLVGTQYFQRKSKAIAEDAIDASADMADETFVFAIEGGMDIKTSAKMIRTSLARLEQLEKHGTLSNELKRRKAWTYWRLSTAYAVENNWKEQERYARMAIEGSENSHDQQDRVVHALAHMSLANARDDQGATEQADESYQHAVREASALMAEYPGDHQVKVAYGEVLAGHAKFQFRQGNVDETIASYRKACPAYEAAATEHSDSVTDARNAAYCSQWLGEHLARTGQFREALLNLELSADAARKRPEIDNTSKTLLRSSLAYIADSHRKLGEESESLRAGIELTSIYRSQESDSEDADATDEDLQKNAIQLLFQAEEGEEIEEELRLRAFDECSLALSALADQNPTDTELKRLLVRSLVSAGGVAADMGRNGISSERFNGALKVLDSLVELEGNETELEGLRMTISRYAAIVAATPEGVQPDFSE